MTVAKSIVEKKIPAAKSAAVRKPAIKRVAKKTPIEAVTPEEIKPIEVTPSVVEEKIETVTPLAVEEEAAVDVEAVLRRVKKLLATAAGTANLHESEVAAGMAAKLMAKFNITMAEVIKKDLMSYDDAIIDGRLSEWQWDRKAPQWVGFLATGIAKVFSCECTLKYDADSRGYKLNIFGYRPDVEISQYLFAFLSERFQFYSNEAYKNGGKIACLEQDIKPITWKMRYMEGLSSGIVSCIRDAYEKDVEEFKGGSELVILKHQKIEEKFGKFTYSKSDVAITEEFAAGYAKSKTIDLNKVIKDETVQAPLVK